MRIIAVWPYGCSPDGPVHGHDPDRCPGQALSARPGVIGAYQAMFSVIFPAYALKDLLEGMFLTFAIVKLDAVISEYDTAKPRSGHKGNQRRIASCLYRHWHSYRKDASLCNIFRRCVIKIAIVRPSIAVMKIDQPHGPQVLRFAVLHMNKMDLFRFF